jgi:26S proteasome regulatory subunit N10
MGLESTMICVDNSEFMRNGDYLPTRLQAQQDAVNLIAHSKTRANPESNVALMTLSDLSVLVTLTTDTGKLLAKLHQVGPTGNLRFISGIKIAHLALKHRQGKNHKTRIIAFVGSPIEADEKDLVKLAKKLKKEKVNVDIINIGEEEANTNLLNKFVETINGKEGTSSHLVTIPPGPHLSDALVSSPILQGEDGGGAAAGGGGGYEFGVDPNDDPELALALRVSMEEQRARQQADTGANTAEGQEAPASGQPAPTPGEDTSEEAMLQRALAMSMDGGESGGEPDLAAMTEEEQIAYAMRMSMAEGGEGSSAAGTKSGGGAESMEVDDKPAEEEDYSEVMNDPAFLQSVLQNLPGVDPQSEAIKNAVGAVKDEKKDDKDKEKK